MKKTILTVLAVMFLSFEAYAQSFTATVNRNEIPEGETFVLTFNLQDVDTSQAPDLSVLSNDFTVFSVSNGYRTSIVNGDVSKSRQWNIVLMPNKTGEITIPSIDLAGYKSNEIKLNVVPAGAEVNIAEPKVAPSPKFKISGEVDNKNPFVQQQINYQLKIYDAGGLQGDAPVFMSQNDDWVIRGLGEPKIETKIINGQSLREITFNYALFAQKSGKLTIPAVKFSGYYLSKSTRSDPFARFFEEDDFFSGFGMHDVFATRTPVLLTSKPIEVEVKPALSNDGWWLPAEDVRLSAEFVGGTPQFKVGEAVSRNIYLKAVGAMTEQLPEIKFADIKGIKQYPEKPQTEMREEGGDIVSYVKIANVYIPDTAGEVTLPAVKVKWFNTLTQSFETATIPEYKTYVAAGNGNQVMPQPQSKAAETAVAEPVEVQVVTSENVNQDNLYWLIGGAFAGGILLTLLLLKLASAINNPSSNHKKIIISAAKNKDLHLLKDELLLWAAQEFPRHKIANLQDVADIFDNQEFNKELDKIRETLYSEDSKDWDNKNFVEVFNKISKHIKKHKRSINEPLPKLYK